MGSSDLREWETVVLQYHRYSPLEGIKTYVHHMYPLGWNTGALLEKIIQSCTKLKNHDLGLQLHNLAVKSGNESDFGVQKSVFRLYVASGLMVEAKYLFKTMYTDDIGIWTDYIAACRERNEILEAHTLFNKLLALGSINPDQRTLSVIISSVNTFVQGKSIHGYMYKSGLMFPNAMNAMVHFYGRNGSIEDAIRALYEIQEYERNIVNINCIMTCYSINGYFLKVIEFWKELGGWKVEPDEVTFLMVLKAYASLWLVDEAAKLYNMMKIDLGRTPTFKHNVVMVAAYGQCGQYDQATAFIKNLKKEGNGSSELNAYWRTLGIMAKNNHDYEEGIEALQNLTTKEAVDCINLGQLYHILGHMVHAQESWKQIKDKQLKRVAGISRVGN